MTKKAPNPIDKHVGSRVRMRRMLVGMSQEKLGEALGLTFQQVQKYEKGTNRIGASRLHHIASILGVPIDFLYQGAPRMEASASGAADEQASADLSEFLSSSDGVELMRGFLAIKDAKVRRRVVELVACLSQQVGETAAAPALRRTGS
ncbi:MAG TPA: helix-turn-helix domain-containing protein [Beijerinckiaceae bacterium]|nr:helix-turn-helix domain-containing protein [Beijerinckiaceae bacterium]